MSYEHPTGWWKRCARLVALALLAAALTTGAAGCGGGRPTTGQRGTAK